MAQWGWGEGALDDQSVLMKRGAPDAVRDLVLWLFVFLNRAEERTRVLCLLGKCSATELNPQPEMLS